MGLESEREERVEDYIEPPKCGREVTVTVTWARDSFVTHKCYGQPHGTRTQYHVCNCGYSWQEELHA